MYTGTMSGIDESLVESVQLDGANIIQEFIHITFPMIYRTYVTFLIVSIAGLFTSTMALHTFFGTQSNYKTIGYDIYINVLNSDVYVSPGSMWMSYPVISAYGLILTAFVAPATLLLKKFLEKIGPSTN
jgi:ABC-type sugar transport system permease subunit